MKLSEVVRQEQFADYYRENNLNGIGEKIDNLIRAMKIRAIMRDEDETDEENLVGLEETALRGIWRASW